ncbi:MAG: endonuclease/exonuclease/phosphatase family protein, partial [Ferruginibacter sp.]
MKPGSFFIKLILYINAVSILLLLLSAYSYLISPEYFWWVAALALAFPILIGINLLFILFWLVFKKQNVKFSLIGLLLIIPVIFNYLPLNITKEFEIRDTSNFRVLTWNVGLMSLTAKDTQTAIIKNLEILNSIKSSNADVVCLQEFLTSKVPDGHYNFMDSITRTMGYPYRYFSNDHGTKEDFFFSGSIIFSKHKIIEVTKSTFNDDFSGSVIKATILYNTDTIDVITTRLQSPGLKQNEYSVLSKLKQIDPKAVKGSRGLVRKLKNG